MRHLLILGIAISLTLSQASVLHASTSNCIDLVTSLLPVQKWRDKLTHMNSEKAFTDSSASREKDIRKSITSMENDILTQDSTPGMEYFFSDNVSWKYLRDPGDYGTGIFPKISVSGLGSSGKLPLTLLLPVSGHDGAASARRWAKSDTFKIILEKASGSSSNLVNGNKSLGVVTVQEVVIPLKKGETVKVMYDRSGSLGPSGFPEGRILEIVWDGK